MAMPEYQDSGPVRIPTTLDTDAVKGKSVLITGAASGLGQAYAHAFAKAGAFVTLVDFNKTAGSQTAEEIGSNAQFVACDVTNWRQLVNSFEASLRNSPSKSLDIVIANAGIAGQDDMFALEGTDPLGPPRKPDLKILDVNLTGLLYTVKLAIHYFRRQPIEPSRDRCMILKSSLAGYVDIPGSIQYNTSKFGVRGVMRSLRRSTWKEGIRVNLVAPWWIRTPMLPQVVQNFLDSKGVGFALADDCCKAVLLIASDRTVNGRALGVVSRAHNEQGVMDLELDDYASGSLYSDWQRTVLDTAGNRPN